MAFRSVFLLATLAILLPGESPAQGVLVEDFEWPTVTSYLVVSAGDSIVTLNNTWHVTVNSVDVFNGPFMLEAEAYDGVQAVDLTGSPGAGIMETSFATTPGEEYELAFFYARNTYGNPSVVEATVSVIGTSSLYQGYFSHDIGTPFGTYLPYQAHFTADSTHTLLRFTSLTDGVSGITLDGVSVTGAAPVAVGPGDVGAGRDYILSVHPNPFSRAVALDYETAEPGFVEARIYDVRGRLVDRLVAGDQAAGPHSTIWAGSGPGGTVVSSGIYFFVLTTPRGTTSQRLLLIR